jgi:hypothetical protein
MGLDAQMIEVAAIEDTSFSPSRPNPTHRLTN